MTAGYSALTDDEFDEILIEILNEQAASTFVTIDGIYEILREEFNNTVLERWEQRHPDLAFPEETEDRPT